MFSACQSLGRRLFQRENDDIDIGFPGPYSQGYFWVGKLPYIILRYSLKVDILVYISLQEINISHLGKRKNIDSNMPYQGDMLIPWRVSRIDTAYISEDSSILGTLKCLVIYTICIPQCHFCPPLPWRVGNVGYILLGIPRLQKPSSLDLPLGRNWIS